MPECTGHALKAPEVLENMLFFKAAGSGAASDNSTNSYEPFVDMSDLLDQNRAILVGYAREPALQLANGGNRWLGQKRSALDGVSLCLSDQQGKACHAMTACHTLRIQIVKGPDTP